MQPLCVKRASRRKMNDNSQNTKKTLLFNLKKYSVKYLKDVKLNIK